MVRFVHGIILKTDSFLFKTISSNFKLFKLHQHSHLYTSESLIKFPGRQFKIKKILPYNKKELKKESILKANIATRNFPETVIQIRKKLKIKDGGSIYLFFTKDINNNNVVIICKKVNR